MRNASAVQRAFKYYYWHHQYQQYFAHPPQSSGEDTQEMPGVSASAALVPSPPAVATHSGVAL
jgi:hypothetical protein